MKLRALLWALLLGCQAARAAAQPGAAAARARAAQREPALSIKSRFGPEAAERLLKSRDPEQRLRALERLAAHDSHRAIDLLASTLETSAPSQSDRERLVAVRGLAAHAREPRVRQALLRAMTGSGTTASNQTERDTALATWVRSSAALALAASGDEAALSALGLGLRQGGSIAELSAAALTAHPPRNIDAILRARGSLTPALVELLGRIGDQRAFSLLRSAVRRGGPELASRAALALTRLGALETVDLARHWLKTKRDPLLLLSAAEILTLTRAPERSAAILRALQPAETHARALELALSEPGPRLIDALARELRRADDPLAARCLSALARSGDARALELLRSELVGRRGAAAAYALALAEAPPAGAILEAALGEARARPHALRALVIRERTLGVRSAGARETARALLASREPRERAAAAWALASLEPERGAELLRARDPVVLHAAARAALRPELATVAARRLATEPEPAARAALSLALVSPAAADGLPTALLVDLLEHVPVAAPLAARALAARAAPDLYARLEALQSSTDAWLRAHVAQGLGRAADPRARGWLVSAYRFETSVMVRRAIARALSRNEPGAERATLSLMAALDPDPAVRASARSALLGSPVTLAEQGGAAAWFELNGRASDTDVALSLLTPSGSALPALPDPDGTLTLLGLPEGLLGVRLAALPKRGHAGP